MSLSLSKKENELGILSFTPQVSSFPSIILLGKKAAQLDPIFPNYGWHTRCHHWRFESTNLVKAYNTHCQLCFFRWRNWGTRRQLSDGHLTSPSRFWISIQNPDTQIVPFNGWWRIWKDEEVRQKQVPKCPQPKPAHSYSRPLRVLDLMIQNELGR